ncbi:MAG TPA: hypothetical protein DDW78_07995 [Treponema sp.]|nr:hypothetical protein [Treponema sp.]
MQIIQSLKNFLQELFTPTAPEVKKRVALRKLGNELRAVSPSIYADDLLQPNFAEALRILYVNTKPLHNLLSETICSEDIERNFHFAEQLMLTGFSEEGQAIIESLSYQNRKDAAAQADDLPRFFEMERVQLDKVLKELKSPQFTKIDTVINKLKQLSDICKFNYMSVLHLFDANYNPDSPAKPNFQPVPLTLVENALQDLYYIIAGMDINTSTNNAVLALYQLYNRSRIDKRKQDELVSSLRKVQSVIKKVLRTDTLLMLVRMSKGAPDFMPEKNVYESDERQRYSNYLENRFTVDEGRLKNALQEENISNEVHALFGDSAMETLRGYNDELNMRIKQDSPCAFYWVLPMQVLKTFLVRLYKEHVKLVLDDIVIEGFFNAPDYKKDFAAEVYAVNDSLAHIEQFEMLFQQGGEFDEALITGLLRDGHKDPAFLNRLKDLMDKIDKRVKSLLQAEVNNLYQLDEKVGEILVESKKPMSDVITNLKVLMMSSRNRDHSEFLEKTYSSWTIFFDIMKEYVVLKKDKKS